MEFPFIALLVLLVAFAWNVLATAVDLPWFLRPFAALRYLVVELGSRAAEWFGTHVAALYAAVAELLTRVFERLVPALRATLTDLFDILGAWVYLAGAFFDGWRKIIVEYRAVQFLIHPTTLFYLSCIVGVAVVYIVGMKAWAWYQRRRLIAAVSAGGADAPNDPATPRGVRQRR